MPKCEVTLKLLYVMCVLDYYSFLNGAINGLCDSVWKGRKMIFGWVAGRVEVYKLALDYHYHPLFLACQHLNELE